MNWFHLLEDCGPDSLFYRANVFFNRYRPKLGGIRTEARLRFDAPAGLWIDSFTEQLLYCIDDFLSYEWKSAASIVRELQRSPLLTDRNNADKLTLIEARLCEAVRDLEGSRRAYFLLQDHPVFGKEAEAHL
jgi:hypothetical protein